MDKIDHLPHIVRYLRSPIVELDAGGEPFTRKAIVCPQPQLPIFAKGSIRTLVGYRLTEPRAVPLIASQVAEGGHLIFKEISEECLKAFQGIARFKVMMREPMWVLRRVKGKNGLEPLLTVADSRKRVCILRWGAFGDMLMISPIIDHYRELGYHVTLSTTERGQKVFVGDPRIDDLAMVESGVAEFSKGEKLDRFLKGLGDPFDVFVNLAEVLEADLLPRENVDPLYNATWEERHATCNRNYMHAHFVKCGLPVPAGPVHPTVVLTDTEREWGKAELWTIRKKLGKSFIFLWNLMGSSFHKMYPWIYDVWFLVDQNRDDIGFVTVSDRMGEVLEDKRFSCVLHRSGKYTIRQVLALHSAVDAVVTPETFSLPAAFAFKSPVVALLSHSSKEQYFFRDGDIPLSPPIKDCPCYPCHQIHYSRLSCRRGNFNHDATLCMDSITPGALYQALLRIAGGSRNVDDSRGVDYQG